ncbi:DUF4307 domain-containing protein [Georgenia alba]|uniref:DUF4307 domain-containing protein n=1 Tax=Georgenia alba TaxID=2233858 RepID=A0ABW2Q7C0_9MICO
MTVPAEEHDERGAAPGGGSAVDPAIMAARYGRTRTSRRTVVLAAILATLVVGAGLGVQAANLTRPSVMTDDLGFTVHDATRTTVRFAVRTEPGTTVRCALVALNTNHTQVGYREVEIGPSPEQTTSHVVDVTTTELATTGSVEECSIIDSP